MNEKTKLERMLYFAKNAYKYAEDVTIDKLIADEQYQYSLLYPLGQIGEYAISIDKALKYLNISIDTLYPDVHWDDWRGFRNRVYHDYDKLDFEKVMILLTVSLPELIEQLPKVIDSYDNVIEDEVTDDNDDFPLSAQDWDSI